MTRHALLVGTLLVGLSGAAFGQGKPSRTTAVPLQVVVEAVVEAVGMAIQGDGLPYVDGAVDGTKASLDTYGNLIVSFGRDVHFNFDGLAEGEAPATGWYSSYISTLNFSDSIATGVKLQDLPVGAAQCVQLNWSHGPDIEWRIGFHRDRELPDQAGTSYAVVTRTGPDTWEVEPRAFTCAGGYKNPDNVAAVFTFVKSKRTTTITDHGRKSMPFKLVLSRLGS